MTGSKNSGIHVVGGGLAGITAAWSLARRGKTVHLWESRPRLGGRVSSLTEPGTGLEMDNGVHVHLGACTETARLFREWGLTIDWQDPMAVGYRSSADSTAWLREGRLPAPFHLAASFLGFNLLSPLDKLEVARHMARALFMSDSALADLDTVSFADWLGPTRENVRRVFWDPVMESTLNGKLEMCSTALALFVLREGFLLQKEGARIGRLRATQGEGVSGPMAAVLEEAGVTLHLGTRCEGVVSEGERVTGLRAEGETHAGEVLLAVTHEQVLKLLPEAWQEDAFFRPLSGWGSWPILNVAYLTGETLAGESFLCTPYHESQWIFRRQEPAGGTWLIASISAAFDHLKGGKEALIGRIEQNFRDLMPDFAAATIKAKVLLPQMKATFAGEPGQARRRLPQRTPFSGLTLAGAWTDTGGWPDTQEGAIRSGLRAAKAIQS